MCFGSDQSLFEAQEIGVFSVREDEDVVVGSEDVLSYTTGSRLPGLLANLINVKMHCV